MKNQRVNELLSGKGENYILPFFWQHGESHETLREYVNVIRNAGCRAVCIEARPHPDFAGEGWWSDMDVILDEAKKLDMKVWILDDAHFPTGFAAGVVKNAPNELRKQYLNYARVDVCGPQAEVEIPVGDMIHPMIMPGGMFGQQDKKHFDDDTLFHVVAWKTEPMDKMSDPIDLTPLVENGKLYWSAPDGYWKIFVLYLTHNGVGRDDYINMLDYESCTQQINAVYEPHYAHYKELFGNTIAGFFSDEPLIGNAVGYDFDESIGRKDMALPWSKYVPDMLKERLGQNWKNLLPLLWQKSSEASLDAKVRVGYMDTVTRLVERCFSYQLGDWCKDHGVMYIGHLVEDNGQHARLGSSLGHYFRGLAGQHMAGIDNIGNQVLIGGGDSMRPKRFGGQGDGEFYHYELGKLGSSHSHIDPRKEGRALCENFGAYGWGTGVKTMKYLADHFIVRGINHFTPHAFSPMAFPDPDCPPHFYAHGENPQYRAFGKLIDYMNRACHLISGGISLPDVALLYHGENEWAGDYQADKILGRELTEHQIDFDIVPADLFADMKAFNSELKDGLLWLNGRLVQALLIPYAQFIPAPVAKFVGEAKKAGFPVFCSDKLPEGVSNADEAELDALNLNLSYIKAVPTSEMTKVLAETITRDVTVSPDARRLTIYHYRAGQSDTLLLLNEDPGKAFNGDVTVHAAGTPVIYDALDNLLRPVKSSQSNGQVTLSLHIEPLELKIISFGGESSDTLTPYPTMKYEKVLSGFKVSRSEGKSYPAFTESEPIEALTNMARKYPEFSGYYRYETTAELTGNETVLAIDDAYEAAELFINGVSVGTRFAAPYHFDVTGLVKEGKNEIAIEVATTLERKVNALPPQGGLAALMGKGPMSATGIVGEVRIG